MSGFRQGSAQRAFQFFVPFLFLASVASAAAISITVQPGAQLPVTTGEQVSVDLNIVGLGASTTPSLGVYDLNLTFDPTLLSFANVNWGNGLDLFQFGDVRNVNASAGLLNVSELSLDSATDLDALQPASFLLASLQFIGVGTGTSNIALSINALGDANGEPLSADIVYGSGSVSNVPEPSTGILLFICGGTMWGWRYHQQRKRQNVKELYI
jgi:hypothetical protein